MQRTVGQDVPMGRKFRCVNPGHDDRDPSANLYEKDSVIRYKCFGCSLDEDVIGMRMLLTGESFHDAVAALTNGGISYTPPMKSLDGKGAKPDRSTAGGSGRGFENLESLLKSIERKYGKVEAVYHYGTETENHLIVVRYLPKDDPEHKKFWQTRREGGRYYYGAPPKPHPLYRRDLIATAETVLVLEGEKCVIAVNELNLPGIAATTSPGGGNGAILRDGTITADWSPLQGRHVIVWPDGDDTGAGYRDAVLQCLQTLPTPPTEILEICPADLGLSGKQDVVDYLESGRTLQDALATAKPVEDRESTRWKVFTLNSLFTCVCRERSYILKPIIESQSIVILYAERGVGKSWTALSIAYAVASGSRLWKYEVDRPHKVLLVIFEEQADTVRKRAMGLVAGFDGGGVFTDENLRFLIGSEQDEALPDLRTKEGQAFYDELIGDAELIILDNLSAGVKSGNENDSADWKPIQNWLVDLKRRGKSILLVDHSGKDPEKRSRGTSHKEDLADTVICLKHPTGYRAPDGATFQVIISKGRSIYGPDAEPFDVSLHGEGDALEWRWGTRQSKASQALEMVDRGDSQMSVAEYFGVTKGTISKWVKAERERAMKDFTG